MRRSILACLALFACSGALAQSTPVSPKSANPPAAQSAAPATRNPAGVIALAEGDARIAPGGNSPRAAKAGDVVSEGDLLITGKNGEIHVKMQDTAFLVVRPNTRMQVSEYVADGGDSDKGVLSLLAGGVRAISGWIGKYNSRAYVLKTPTATIGIRGTDHETRYIPEGSDEGDAGTYDRVYAGQTSIDTADGQSTTLSPNQAGYHPLRSRDKPRVLASIPKFYQPGPHEAEINQKHAQIQKQIFERRQERQKVIAEKRAALEESRSKMMDLAKQNKAAGGKPLLTPAQKRELKARHEALAADTKAAMQQQQALNAKRKALDDDVKAGKVSLQDANKQRKALREQEADLAKTQESLKQRRQQLQESADATIEKRLDKVGTPEMRDQYEETKEKRKALQDERESTAKEMKDLHQEEAKRYREELKNDKKAADPPSK